MFGGRASGKDGPARPEALAGPSPPAFCAQLEPRKRRTRRPAGRGTPTDHQAGDSPAKPHRHVAANAHGSWPPSLGAAEPGGDRGARPSAHRVLGTLHLRPAPRGKVGCAPRLPGDNAARPPCPCLACPPRFLPGVPHYRFPRRYLLFLSRSLLLLFRVAVLLCYHRLPS